MTAPSYRTLCARADASAEVEDRRSRFIALMRHVESEAEADAFVAEVRARHHDARHNVPAWILADGRERCSDDGEPQRTAGMPVLEVLRGAGLADVCCVVTRYFGGTLLGPGGLVRAYTGATQAAVAGAETDGRGGRDDPRHARCGADSLLGIRSRAAHGDRGGWTCGRCGLCRGRAACLCLSLG